MKLQSPVLMGAMIFTGNISLQAATSGSLDVDLYRAGAVAILAAIAFFVISPLFRAGSGREPEPKPVRVRVKEPFGIRRMHDDT